MAFKETKSSKNIKKKWKWNRRRQSSVWNFPLFQRIINSKKKLNQKQDDEDKPTEINPSALLMGQHECWRTHANITHQGNLSLMHKKEAQDDLKKQDKTAASSHGEMKRFYPVLQAENFTPSSSAEEPLKMATLPFCSSNLRARIRTPRSIPWSSGNGARGKLQGGPRWMEMADQVEGRNTEDEHGGHG